MTRVRGSQISRRSLIGGAGAFAGAAMTPWWYRPAAAQDEVTLDVYVFDGHPFYWVQPLFEEAYPNIKLNMMGQSDVAVFRAALAAGKDVPDIIWPSEEYIQDLGRSGVLFDTTALIEEHKENLSPSATNAVYIEQTGRYAGFPGDLAPVGIYSSKQGFPSLKAGPGTITSPLPRKSTPNSARSRSCFRPTASRNRCTSGRTSSISSAAR